MELSERGRYVTDFVAMWIENDGEYFERARELLIDPDRFERFLSTRLRQAQKGTAAWYTAQELAPNDYARIDWAEVARRLKD